jgi:hypothetical protein
MLEVDFCLNPSTYRCALDDSLIALLILVEFTRLA